MVGSPDVWACGHQNLLPVMLFIGFRALRKQTVPDLDNAPIKACHRC